MLTVQRRDQHPICGQYIHSDLAVIVNFDREVELMAVYTKRLNSFEVISSPSIVRVLSVVQSTLRLLHC